MQVSRSLNAFTWGAIACTFTAPLLGYVVGVSQGVLFDNKPLKFPTWGGDLPHLLILLGLAGLAWSAAAQQFKLYLDERLQGVARSNFTSAVTHELRTPLATIRMFADLLRQDLVLDPAQRQELLDNIVGECDRLGGLIDDVLAHAALSEKRRALRFETLDVAALVEEALASLRGPLALSGLSVQCDIPYGLKVQGDRLALTHALVNLIGNATKYAADGRVVHVKACTRGEEVAIAVKDYGPGIAPAEQKRVFEPYYRIGDELTRTRPGTGLGLALVADYIRAHKGKVSLCSQPGKGAEFTLLLPAGKEAA